MVYCLIFNYKYIHNESLIIRHSVYNIIYVIHTYIIQNMFYNIKFLWNYNSHYYYYYLFYKLCITNIMCIIMPRYMGQVELFKVTISTFYSELENRDR